MNGLDSTFTDMIDQLLRSPATDYHSIEALTLRNLWLILRSSTDSISYSGYIDAIVKAMTNVDEYRVLVNRIKSRRIALSLRRNSPDKVFETLWRKLNPCP